MPLLVQVVYVYQWQLSFPFTKYTYILQNWLMIKIYLLLNEMPLQMDEWTMLKV